jgi:hypothetical protein
VNLAGITSFRSRTTHVVRDAEVPALDTPLFYAPAACGRLVEVRRYEVKEASDVCLKCRKAMGWPFIVTWKDKWGNTFTTDFTPEGKE